MGCATFFVPVLGSQGETFLGQINMLFVDRQFELARRHGLKLGLVWFGSSRRGSARFANLPVRDGSSGFTSPVPANVHSDWITYRRAARPEEPVSHPRLGADRLYEAPDVAERKQATGRQVAGHVVGVARRGAWSRGGPRALR
jgi:hypothetical protein